MRDKSLRRSTNIECLCPMRSCRSPCIGLALCCEALITRRRFPRHLRRGLIALFRDFFLRASLFGRRAVVGARGSRTAVLQAKVASRCGAQRWVNALLAGSFGGGYFRGYLRSYFQAFILRGLRVPQPPSSLTATRLGSTALAVYFWWMTSERLVQAASSPQSASSAPVHVLCRSRFVRLRTRLAGVD